MLPGKLGQGTMPAQDIEGLVVSSSAERTVANMVLACWTTSQPDTTVERARGVFTVVLMSLIVSMVLFKEVAPCSSHRFDQAES